MAALLLLHGAAGLALPASLNASNAHGRAAEERQCSDPFQPCFDTKCCHGQPKFGCMKRQFKMFALCKRIEDSGCVSDTGFQCPGEWEECTTGRFAPCWDSMCCKDSGYGCMRRGTSHFAQCRPQADCEAAGSQWQCPGTWTKPAGEGIPPPPPRQCSQPFQPCTDTHCCEGKAFHCIEKKSAFFAQCIRPESCVKDATHLCNDVEGTLPYSPPPPPPAAKVTPQRAQPQRAAPAARAPAAAAPVQASGGGGGGNSTLLLILIFLVAIGLGVGGVFLYLQYASPKPPTEAPQPDDADDAPTEPKKGKKGGKAADAEDDEVLDKKKAKKKTSKKRDEEGMGLRAAEGDVDGFD